MLSSVLPGCRPDPRGGSHFLLWAPRARRVTLRLVGPVHRDLDMTPLQHGYHEAHYRDIAPGQRYFFRLDHGPDRPDPASYQFADSVHGPSIVADFHFAWHDHDWHGIGLSDVILYELHIGTFTASGTFDAAISQLDSLRELGVNAIEVMPVAQFPGQRNWGYDGVGLFAVQHSYGGIAAFKRFIDAAHQRGIAVILDVVYNHLGPEGNYLREFGPYFGKHHATPWGDSLNFDGPDCDAVRAYFLANARYWQEEFHLDGLRLDAVPFIRDDSAKHLLADLSEQAESLERATGRPFWLIGESDINDLRVLRSREVGGYGLHTQWTDDVHHALHAYLTGERCGYYADYGTLEHLAKAMRDAFVLDGRYSHYRRRRYGASAGPWRGEQFVTFIQNHDQIGNRPRGERLASLVDVETLKLSAAVMLLSPFVPMLFMGEEHGETNPFAFFVNHGDGGLVHGVREGRKREAKSFGWPDEPLDPGSEHTFFASRPDWSKAEREPGRTLREWYRLLIRLRSEWRALGCGTRDTVEAWVEQEILWLRRGTETEEVVVAFCFAAKGATVASCAGEVLLQSGVVSHDADTVLFATRGVIVWGFRKLQ
jgi:maltooligosyltrehalose trehalohydrolase